MDGYGYGYGPCLSHVLPYSVLWPTHGTARD